MKQSLTLLLAICIGGFFPQLAFFSPLLSYLLGIMLFFSFTKARITADIFREKRIYWILCANICIGWASYFCILPWNSDLAFIGFVVGMIPTALAAPAVIAVLGGKIEFAIGSVMVTNFGIGLLFPFFTLFVSPFHVSTFEMLTKISLLLCIPLIISSLIKRYMPALQTQALNASGVVFYLWASIIIISIARASEFLRMHWAEYSDSIAPIALISAILCIANFAIGHVLGGKQFYREASQSLGQKNPMLMIWLSLEFFTPLVALGPTFYIVFHNLINAYKMIHAEKKNTARSAESQ